MSVMFILMLVSLCSADQPHLMAKRKSFTMDLIHRDSLLLGRHNYSINSSELLRKAVLRSFTQASRFSSSENFTVKAVDSVMVNYGGDDYLMRLIVGVEKNEVLALAATGTDFIWIKCDSFVPSELTHKQLFHDDPFCDALKAIKAKEGLCRYKYSYLGKKGYTAGILSTDNFYLESTEDDFTTIVFGCSNETRMPFSENVQGVVGLGRGELSLISQLVGNRGIEHRFSYCLVPRSAETNSKIRFGENRITRSNTISTSITYLNSLPYYYLSLKGIKIGEANEAININKYVIINSGNCITFLPLDAFSKLAKQVQEEINIELTPDPSDTFKLCFDQEQLAGKILPQMVLQFHGGDLQLKTENMFVKYHELKCLAISPSHQPNIFVIGSIPQIDFWVEYDLNEQTISFTPTDCTQVQP